VEWLNAWKDRDLIKIITGMRRCGKSTIMKLFQQELLDSGVPEKNIVSINLESLEEAYPQEQREFYRYVVQKLAPHGMNYVFLDEIQNLESFEKVAAALNVREDVDLYLTGSNAYFLSGELATFLTGRYIEIQAHPLSFKEYASILPDWQPATLEAAFERYRTYGAMPYVTALETEREITLYLDGVYASIIVKDIATRRPKIDVPALKATASFLADNIGNVSSMRRISEGLERDNKDVSRQNVSEIVYSLLESYLLYKVGRVDLRGMAYLKTHEKYYLADLSFRYWLLGKSQGDVGRRLENIIYLELARRNSQINIGKQQDREIDFVTTNSGRRAYYQVSQTVQDSATLSRELTPLLRVNDSYPKTVLTMDYGSSYEGGIEIKNAIDWLLDISE